MTGTVIDVGNFSHINPTPFIQTSLQSPSQRHVCTQHNSLMMCHRDPESAGVIGVFFLFYASGNMIPGQTMFTLLFELI